MFRRMLAFLGPFVVKNLQDYHGGPLHRLEQAAAKSSEDALRFAADAERARLDDGRQSPGVIVSPQPGRTPAEERRRIDGLPIP